MDFDTFKTMGTYVGENTDLKFDTGQLRRDGQKGFNTPSGRIEFTSKVLEDHGHDPVPDYQIGRRNHGCL